MNPLLLLLLLLVNAAPIERGNLVLDGLPEIPKELSLRVNQYNNTRGAVVADWLADGSGLLVSTRFGDTNQVHRVRAPLGMREQLTFYPEPVSGARADAKAPGGFYYRMDQGGSERFQIYWYDLATGGERLLTDGTSRHEALVVAPLGGRIAFASTERNGTDFDVVVMDDRDVKSKRIAYQGEGKWSPLGFSSDGTKLLVSKYVSINESYLHLLDVPTGALTPVHPDGAAKVGIPSAALSGDGRAVFFSSDLDNEFARLYRYDVDAKKAELLTRDLPWDVTAIELSDDGKQLAYAVNEGGKSALFVASTRDVRRARKVALPVGVVFDASFDPSGKRLAVTMSTAETLADVWMLEVATHKLVRWTESEVGGLPRSGFVTPELVEFPSFDARKIPAWYYKPKAASAPLPVIISVHGGPEAQLTAAFNTTFQLWVDKLGAAVLAPNVRGSSGYGKTYLTLDNAEKREDSVKDIGALLDWVATRPELDKQRVCVIGGSYGGYMTLASLVHYGDRLRCGVDVVGISSFVTFLTNTESYRRDLRRAEYGDERDPAMRDLLTRISPLTNAARIADPLFVAQGKNDPRVPASEAEQIVATVRKGGRDVWYLLAKDEGHGFQKKQNRDFYTTATVLFFERHLLPSP
jgi:dipeptidyl aminopeptidase/acylaminoacyl peptidase